MKEHTILFGRRGESGLVDIVNMIRFDNPIEVYICVVLMNDDNTFSLKEDNLHNIEAVYKFVRKIFIPRNCAVIDVYYNDITEMYYVNLAQAAPGMNESTENFFRNNIDDNYGPYYMHYINGATRLVKVLYD